MRVNGNFSDASLERLHSVSISRVMIPSEAVDLESLLIVRHTLQKWFTYSRGGQHVDRDRPVDRRVPVGRSRLILH